MDDTCFAYLNDANQRTRDRRARRGRRRPAPALHQADQRGRRRPARRPDADRAHVPRQLPLLVGRRGRLRLRRRAAALRARRRRLLHGVRRRPLGRLRAAPLRAQGQVHRPRPGHVEAARARVEGRDQATARSRLASTSPIEQLCLSPQCGFSSTVEGNSLTIEEEKAKLRLVVEVAERGLGLAPRVMPRTPTPPTRRRSAAPSRLSSRPSTPTASLDLEAHPAPDRLAARAGQPRHLRGRLDGRADVA